MPGQEVDRPEALDATRISAALSPALRARIERLEIAPILASTNTELLTRDSVPAGRSAVLLAEQQTAGRGRRGRTWIAPPGGAICLSFTWTFAQPPRDISALSLAVGVCVLRALATQGIHDAKLKWPNDLVCMKGAEGDFAKLGGILIESRRESSGSFFVVIGIGINVALGAQALEDIKAQGAQAMDLQSLSRKPLSRNALAAELIEAGLKGVQVFEQEGLRSFMQEWREADALAGRVIEMQPPPGSAASCGIARGIDTSGALLVELPQGSQRLQKITSGEVTVRVKA